MDNLLNNLVKKLLVEGSAEFSKDGLNIKAFYDNGCLNIKTTFKSPKEDNKTEKLLNSFEDYVKSLSDELFIELVESFEEGRLKELQDKLDTKQFDLVTEAISEFMANLKQIAHSKVKEIDKDIKDLEEELTELIENRDSYIHVINKEFLF
ncbi:MAG: hypothetical protein PUJ51_10595 [Clostridiales bacterium]|uniref:hypothetical protein n=1 Tax=Terrisporobacter sp. TaxID=1965305 RepID=UPI002A5111B5|nr:hypothetical protein [Terrisporobacter sp.]MDD7754930.1 hypothetical protein [Clostridiales bacterium]MDY4134726.1 hypothetical protein [Terrisporobacter sp.]